MRVVSEVFEFEYICWIILKNCFRIFDYFGKDFFRFWIDVKIFLFVRNFVNWVEFSIGIVRESVSNFSVNS